MQVLFLVNSPGNRKLANPRPLKKLLTPWQLIDIKTGRATIYGGFSFAQKEKASVQTPAQKCWQASTKESKIIVLMPDVFTKAKRSQVMARIRGRANKDTELALVKILRLYHITGWRRNQKVFGKPDFLFRRNRLTLFVDGCFWHGCPKHFKMPTGNRAFWKKKLAANKARDHRVNRELHRLGWRVIRIWEHDLTRRADKCIRKIQSALKQS